MESYIDSNIQKRKEVTHEADKNILKLLNNAVYGKTMEKMRKIIKIRKTANEKDFLSMLQDLHILVIKSLVKI